MKNAMLRRDHDLAAALYTAEEAVLMGLNFLADLSKNSIAVNVHLCNSCGAHRFIWTTANMRSTQTSLHSVLCNPTPTCLDVGRYSSAIINIFLWRNQGCHD